MKSASICAFLLVSLGFGTGCTSALLVRSEPTEVSVFLTTPDGADRRELGATPLQITLTDLKKSYGEDLPAGKPFEIVLEKSGYVTERFLVPTTPFGTLSTTLDARLKEGQDARGASDVLSGLFRAQKFGLGGDYERALIEIDKILAVHPKFAQALSLKGSVLFMRKDYAESIKWYEKALAAQPGWEEPIQMITYIRTQNPKLPGARLPATEKTAEKSGP